MLQTLYISNFVLIDKLQLDLQSGFSAFIGETGAGKSILMDAINLVCGDRGSSDVVRHGANKAIIEASALFLIAYFTTLSSVINFNPFNW